MAVEERCVPFEGVGRYVPRVHGPRGMCALGVHGPWSSCGRMHLGSCSWVLPATGGPLGYPWGWGVCTASPGQAAPAPCMTPWLAPPSSLCCVLSCCLPPQRWAHLGDAAGIKAPTLQPQPGLQNSLNPGSRQEEAAQAWAGGAKACWEERGTLEPGRGRDVGLAGPWRGDI